MMASNRSCQSGAIVPNTSWVSVAAYSDKISAEAILGLLSGAGLPAYIKSDEHVPGLGSHFCVFVPPDRVRQAQRILDQGRVSEKELTELATGEKPDG
jgi:cell division septation protein DedD